MTVHDQNQAADTTEEFAERVVGAMDQRQLGHLAVDRASDQAVRHDGGAAAGHQRAVADAAGLSERYVREWLGGVVACRVIDYDPAAQSIRCRGTGAAVLTPPTGPTTSSRVTHFIALLGEVEQKIIGCFHYGGGLPYSDYPPFHKLMAEQSGEVFDAALVDVVLPMAEGLPDRLRGGADVADIGCGSGHAINVMAQAFPPSRFTGIDFSEEGLAAGARRGSVSRADQRDLPPGRCRQLDAAETYDAITVFDAIHDQAQPAQVLTTSIARCGRVVSC